ncbi:MAG TPA: thioredoxin domain-containing protein [Gemmatimonadales bacterium]|nr:thioredoxin domain-containing protein [Gemmatimonadales bacterium]
MTLSSSTPIPRRRSALFDFVTLIVAVVLLIGAGWRLLDPTHTTETEDARRVRADRLSSVRAVLFDAPTVVAPAGYRDSIVVFSDYFCEYCRAQEEVLAKLRFDGVGLAVIYRQMPLTGIHPYATSAAAVAVCAAAIDQFERVHTALFRDLPRWTDKVALTVWLQAIGMDSTMADGVSHCAASGGAQKQLATDRAIADTLGLSQTPTSIIGDPIHVGGLTVTELRDLIATRQVAK